MASTANSREVFSSQKKKRKNICLLFLANVWLAQPAFQPQFDSWLSQTNKLFSPSQLVPLSLPIRVSAFPPRMVSPCWFLDIWVGVGVRSAASLWCKNERLQVHKVRYGRRRCCRKNLYADILHQQHLPYGQSLSPIIVIFYLVPSLCIIICFHSFFFSLFLITWH